MLESKQLVTCNEFHLNEVITADAVTINSIEVQRSQFDKGAKIDIVDDSNLRNAGFKALRSKSASLLFDYTESCLISRHPSSWC